MTDRLTCIIVDDEPLAREGLELRVQQCGGIDILGMFGGGMEAFRFLQNNTVDLLFLDVQMPDLTGPDLLRSLKNPPLVVFTTAYSEYALEGFELDAVDYLVKPIEPTRFLQSVEKVRRIIHLQNQQDTSPTPAATPESIYVRADRQFVKLPFAEIRYIEGMKNYVIFHTERDGKVMTAMSLTLTLDKLPSNDFARVNRSYIVNVRHVKRVLSDLLLLDDGSEVPLGNQYREAFIRDFVKGNLLER